MVNPVAKPTTAGTIATVRHAASGLIPSLKRGKRTVPMTIWVTPPPRLPQPPTRALAVPATSLVNMDVLQYWHITNVDPPRPMKKRRMASEVAEVTSPVHAHGIEAPISTQPMRRRAPYLSQSGPSKKRMKIVPATEQMLDVHACWPVRPRVFLISGMSGAIANQMKNATKKVHHEQWNARMCGLLKVHSLISVDLSFWSGSTLQS
mmetsp:Transcript_850/g.1028  ORF Transcript_850/g.1028 Transcript_850/m.1028 type:complete len:206 (-) Transcript_850:194-811(-)